jgi:hypothetical protein
MGTKNAIQTFQRGMERLLAGLLWIIAVVYVDNCYVKSKDDIRKHCQDLRTVLQRYREFNVKLRPSKCRFGYRRLEVLGFDVGPEGQRPLNRHLQVIKDSERPTNKQELQVFLGLVNYYRKFVKGCSALALPLTQLTRTKEPWIWGTAQEKAWSTLKQKLMNPPVLAFPDYSRQFIVDPDASSFAIGAVLSQRDDDGREHPIRFWSRQMRGAELNYSQTEKEAMAAVEACEEFRPYIMGKPFLLRDDHAALKWLFTVKEPKGRLARWVMRFQEFPCTLQIRKGF